MDTDKLLKAIQILIREELKLQMPQIKLEVAKQLMAERKQQPIAKNTGISMAKAILGESPKMKQQPIKKEIRYTSNPVLNQILNETRENPMDMGDSEFRTANFDTSNMGVIANRAAMAEKMGYGDMVNSIIPTTTIEGRPVNLANEAIAPVVKALERDYTELVKRFVKK